MVKTLKAADHHYFNLKPGVSGVCCFLLAKTPKGSYEQKNVKITVWGINYDPEPTGIGPFSTDLCVFFAEQGHEVVMISTFPYYPWWKKPAESQGKLHQCIVLKGVTVHRCWHWVPSKPSTLKRLIHEMSFLVTSTFAALCLRKPDVFIVISPPLFLGIGAFLASRILRRPFIFHVQDLQPDAALGLGMIKPGLAVKALYLLEKWSYRSAALVSGISQGMLDAYVGKGVPAEKIVMFPNWIPDELGVAAGRSTSASFRATYALPNGVPLIAYSGNVGMKQGLEVVVEAAACARNSTLNKAGQQPEIHWAICGEGAAKPALEERIKAEGAHGVRLYPLQSDDLYHALLREADICLITQQRGTGQFFFPSKLLSILQYGRPVLAVADESSELARAVHQGKFGTVVPPGNAAALLAAVEEMLAASETQRVSWAKNGRGWVDQFRRSRVLTAFEARVSKLISRSSNRL